MNSAARPDTTSTRLPARHCPELLRKGPGPEDLLPLLSRMGERLARRLSGALAPLLGGEAPPVTCSAARESDYDGVRSGIAKLAANSLLGAASLHGGPAAPLLMSIEAEPVLRIVDRAFGGKGEAPGPLPQQFPMAADLMIGRLETLFAQHLSAAISAIASDTGHGASARPTATPVITPVKRDGSLAMLAPFAPRQSLAILTLEVDDGSVLPWLVTLAMPLGTVARLFGFPDPAPDAGASDPALTRRRAANAAQAALAEPFARIPLSVSALLVDMRMPFSAIAALEVGQVLPVVVARAVPLRVGDQVVAHGTVGAVDEHVAIQITQAF